MTESEKSIESKMTVMDEDQANRQKALISKGMDVAEACIESRKETWDKYGDRMAKAIGEVIDQFAGDTEAIQNMKDDCPAKFPERMSRIRHRAAATLKIVEEWKNLLSTHPSLEQKGIFIGKYDGRKVEITPEEAEQRLGKFRAKTVDAEPTE